MPLVNQQPSGVQVVEGRFDDIDALASSPFGWDQHYEQIGRGRFNGQLSQLVLGEVHLARESWSVGLLQRSIPPPGAWAFGLPLYAEASLHIRRRPAIPGELLIATSRDDPGFSTTGRTDLVTVVLPTHLIDRWVQTRRGAERFDVHLPSPHWQVPPVEMVRRATELAVLLNTLKDQDVSYSPSLVEERIFDVILDMIPSAEVVEPLHNRARIARAVLDFLKARLDDPPTVSELCLAVGAKERTLYLSCVEAFGRPPAELLTELRLNAVHRALLHPDDRTSVTAIAAQYGFTQFGRFSAIYRRQFAELPSITLARARGV